MALTLSEKPKPLENPDATAPVGSPAAPRKAGLPVREKIGYGLGDAASNIFFQTVNMFLLFYYTDVFGINPAVAGTLDEPKPEIDLKALAGAALLKYTDKIPGLDEKTGDLLKGVGGILSGQKPANTNTASTNAPATNRPPSGGLLDLLKKPKN